MSALAKFLAKLQGENPFAHGQLTELFKNIVKNHKTGEVAYDLDQMSKRGFWAGPQSEARKYSHGWLAQPEMENMQNVINQQYARLSPDVDEALHAVMNEYPTTQAYRDDYLKIFGHDGAKPHNEAGLLDSYYNRPDVSETAKLQPADPIDSIFDAYGERRRR